MTVFLVIVFVLSLVLVFQAKQSSDRIPTILGYKPLTVLSGSMSPVLEAGDMILTKLTDPEDVKPGDIITYWASESTLVTHRVIEIVDKGGEKAFRTKGDANNVEDGEFVSAEQLVGVMVYKLPYAGYIGRFVRTPQGFVSLVIVPVLLLIVGEIKNIFTKLSPAKPKKDKPEEI